jgi:isoquinoline 1-oxidoreductase alpha subunit
MTGVEMAVATWSFTLNGKPVSVTAEGTMRLLWVLRDYFGLTGTKYGCGIEVCWACAVLINGQTDASCDVELMEVQGKSIVTVEGLAALPEGRAAQAAWIAEQVPQCGYCQSGMLCQTTMHLLKNNPTGSYPNLCVCGTYNRVEQGLKTAFTLKGKV